jgi:iron complex transport system substrate-binding protein
MIMKLMFMERKMINKNNMFAAITAIASGIFALTGNAIAEQNYPIEIEHAYGTTIIEEKPERIATVAWGNHEVPLALGVVPVGMAYTSWGDDNDDGLLPWVDARLKELGAETPVLFNEGDGIDFEAVASTDPDVILAPYSGLSQEDYDTLSEIAPVVSFPNAPWTVGWREAIKLSAAGMGMSAEGDALIAELEAHIEETIAQYPKLREQSVMFIAHTDSSDLSVIRFYSANDSRVSFFEELGMKHAEASEATKGNGKFSGEFSAEQIDAFDDVTLVVTYAGQKLLDAMAADPLVSKMPAVESKSFVMLRDAPMSAAPVPTALMIKNYLGEYVDYIAKAAK